MPDRDLLKCFDNPSPGRSFVIEHVSDEFTSVCPETGHPDFGSVILQYVPRDGCIELKSLKLYYQSFRNEGIYYEAVTNKIAEDLERAMDPIWMQVVTDWKGRGGIRSRITVELGRHPDDAPRSSGGDDFDDEEDDDRLPPGY
ncbi:MAG: preQ(1) synthase [Planctomycetota bacterium]